MSQRKVAVSGFVILAVAVTLAGCGSTPQNPVPSLSSLSPSSVLANQPPPNNILTVNGSNFVSRSVVTWNGTARTTIFVTSNQLQAVLLTGDTQFPGTATVQVVTPAPGGGPSNTLTFTINPLTNPIPAITTLSPSSALAGGQGFTLTVNGSNFVTQSMVAINGANHVTRFVSNAQLLTAVLATDIQTAGTLKVTVVNPAPGGGSSNPVNFAVNNPQPTITSLSPNTTAAGGAQFTLIVTGTGFACAVVTTTCTTSATTINFNGVAQTTTFASSTQVTAVIPAVDITAAQTVQISVINQPPGGGSSAFVPFSVVPTSTGVGLPELVDLSTAGTQASSGIGNLTSSGPSTGGSGRFIAFASVSNNLVPGLANGVANVFARDTCLGVTSGCAPTAVLVSQSTSGSPANAPSLEPSMSSSGRFVVFSSAASNLVSGVSNGKSQIYVRDTCLSIASCSPSTSLISTPDGTTPGDGDSFQPSISPDGQFVAFASTAANLVTTATGGAQEIFVRNTCTGGASGCTTSTSLVTLATDNATPANGASSQPVMNTGGRFVAFGSTATNLVSISSGGVQQVYVRDTCTGVASGCTPATALVSIGADGASSGNGSSALNSQSAPEKPAMSTDGRFIAFSSLATNLLSPGLSAGTPQQIYLRDTCTGATACTAATSLVSIATDNVSPGNGASEHPQVSSTGRGAVFASLASNLVSAAANGSQQIFARDTCAAATACTAKTVLASVAADGTTQGNAASSAPAISSDAHFTAFISFAENLVTNDTTPTLEDIFLAVAIMTF